MPNSVKIKIYQIYQNFIILLILECLKSIEHVCIGSDAAIFYK